MHVGALLFAYASFALACVIGITYVLLFRELKRRTPGVFFQRLPSLQVLDRMNMRAVWIGWLLLTIGLVGGAAVAARREHADGQRPAPAAHDAHRPQDPDGAS